MGYLCAFSLLARTSYAVVFIAAALAVVFAAVLLLAAGLPGGERRSTAVLPSLSRRLLPVAVLVGVTALAQTGLSLILLLHLQRHFSLSPVQVGLVLGPGAIIFALTSGRSHQVTDLIGRRSTLFGAIGATGVMAVMLAFATNTAIITLAWAVAAGCIAAAVPVEQAAIAAASGTHVGQGFSLYGAASLTGAFAGPAAFGALYGALGWQWTCLVVAAVVGLSIPLVPWAVRTSSPVAVPAQVVTPDLLDPATATGDSEPGTPLAR